MENLFCDEEDSEWALVICLEKEFSYMPEPGYLDYLQPNNLVLAKFRAVQWLIEGWKHWMIELLCIACLSIASKFNEISLPSLDELQMEYFGAFFSIKHNPADGTNAIAGFEMASQFYNLKISEHSHYYPSSPVTVLLMERIDNNDCQVDLSLFGMPGSNYVNRESNGTKRKREEE
ncbi:hypothetical protein CRYUN_Cryun05aG0258200 [Craigia yunnanensis]